MANTQAAVINGSLTFQGDVTGGATLQSQAIGGTLVLQLPNTAPIVGQALSAQSVTGSSIILGWTNASGGSGGSGVTSISMTTPTELVVSGSPITDAGTLALSWNTASGNSFIASPANGSAGPYQGRAIVAADLGTGNANTTTYLRGDLSWQTVSGGGGGSGTVTSVSLSSPSEFSVTGSPVTNAGTLTFSKVNQSANTVWAGPTNGSAAQPAFRTLVAADLPAGTGTVTSVAATLPSEFSVSGSPITTSGTLAIIKATQSANQLWAGPTSGSAAVPAFRNLVMADMPSGIGTVTSVALSAPGEFTVSGSPITASGTLTFSKATQLANTHWAGPTSGSAAAPSFRSIVAADLGTGTANTTTYLRGDLSWQTIASGSGTVTSVAMTVPSFLSVTGTPITTSGTLAISLANQSANVIFAGPSSGSAVAPSFRALVAADLPSGTGTVTSVAATVPSEFSVSGSPITASGTLAITKATQTANTLWAGPTSGSAAAPTFRSVVALDLGTGTANTSTFLRGDLTWQSVSGSGTVTSVAMTVPSFLNVSGSPVTTSGTLAVTLATQSANLIFAGPSTGSAASPTFRSLVTADLPAGVGTVTSVAATVPSEFSISGSPITTSGTLAISKATQTANTIWAGPTTGSAAAPAFRALVAADIPQMFVVNSQTTTYQVVAADFAGSKTISVPSGTFTITLVASGSQPASGQSIRIINYGSGVITVARSGQNINGAASNLTIGAASSTNTIGLLVVSDGTNYIAQPFNAVSSVFGRIGAVVASTGDYTAAQVTNAQDNSVSQSANTFHAAPNGSAGVPSFRTIATADLGTGTANTTTYLRGDLSWQTISSGSGTVTSVGLSVPSFLSVSGSPVTTSGTLAVSLATQAANLVFAGPTTGSAVAPTFRSIVAADLGTGTASANTFLRGDLTWQTGGPNSVQSVSTTSALGFSNALTTLIKLTTGSSGITVTLPTAVGVSGQSMKLVKVDSGVGLGTINTTSSQTINSGTTYSLSNQWQYIEVESDNANWIIIANN